MRLKANYKIGSVSTFMRLGQFLVLLLFLQFNAPNASAQNRSAEKNRITRILFLLDGSSSMYSLWENHKRMDLAKAAIIGIIDSLDGHKEVQFALRVYGHQSPEHLHDCNDTKLEVGFFANNLQQIKDRLKELTPRGTTPIALSLEKGAGDFPDTMNARNIIILITDGIESCDGDPCAISLILQKRNVIIKPFVIGIALTDNYSEKMECIGSFYNAKGESSFKNALTRAVSISLTATTAQVNLLDIEHNPTETDINMTFYDNKTGVVKYNFYHTMNERGNSDTFYLDPMFTYDIVMQTTPPVKIPDAGCIYDAHNIFSIACPQGSLDLKIQDNAAKNSSRAKIKCIVRKAGSDEVVNIQEFNTRWRYLVGKYDLEILTLPRIIMTDVAVSQSKTTSIQIPGSGLVNITSRTPGYGGIFIEEGDKLIKIYAFAENTYREFVALQPGIYKVIFRRKNARQSIKTILKVIRVDSNHSLAVPLD